MGWGGWMGVRRVPTALKVHDEWEKSPKWGLVIISARILRVHRRATGARGNYLSSMGESGLKPCGSRTEGGVG